MKWEILLKILDIGLELQIINIRQVIKLIPLMAILIQKHISTRTKSLNTETIKEEIDLIN